LSNNILFKLQLSTPSFSFAMLLLLRCAAALLLLAAAASRSVRAEADDRVLAPAQIGELPFCDAVLCLPKRKFFSRNDYCSAPNSVEGVACSTPVWPDKPEDPSPGARTTMGAFCAAEAELLQNHFPPRTFLRHNDPDYHRESRWCQPKHPLLPLTVIALQDPPWAHDGGTSAIGIERCVGA